MSQSRQWKRISMNPYGFVYEKDKIILKIIPEFQRKEYLFWNAIHLSKNEKKIFVMPDRIFSKSLKVYNHLYALEKGSYYFIYMQKMGKTLDHVLSKNDILYKYEKKIVTDMFKIFDILQKQGFIHGDVHFQNILKHGNRFYLIDFGLVMYKDFCMTKYEQDLHNLYLWSRDDNFTLLSKLIFYKNENLCIKDNDYLKIRQKWIQFFSKNPNDWCKIKDLLEKIFDFSNKEDYYYCFQFYIKNILSPNSSLSPKPGIQIYDMLIKIFLDRTFLISSIFFPRLIKLKLNKHRQDYYKTLISNNLKITS